MPNILAKSGEVIIDGASKALPKVLESAHNLGSKVASNLLYTKDDAIPSTLFFTLLLVVIVAAFYASQYWTINNFYRVYIPAPIYTWGIEMLTYVIDIFMIASIVFYIWNARIPAAGADTDWFISIEYIWVGIQGMKLMWSTMFWRYHHSYLSLFFALVWMILITIFVAILAILFFVRAYWVSGVLTALAAFVYFLFMIFNGYVAYYEYRHQRLHHSHHGHSHHRLSPAKQMSNPNRTAFNNNGYNNGNGNRGYTTSSAIGDSVFNGKNKK